ncbi:MAG: acyl-ACP--UDP-N-acetylglucosamine O-acyltransferase [Phycisphaeraceae bacterium]|nr:acyl-ACP--UDP-N-acetylglucosamine O-acyltransferase [Phycisphaeraceae bacterium]
MTSAAIHPTAIIGKSAHLGEGVRVGPYCVIEDGAIIGDGCLLHGHVTVYGSTTLGKENVLYPYAVLGAEPQDLKFHGEESTLVIGDRNRIREHTTLHRGTEVGGGRTTVGSDCLIMVGAHVAHDCVIEDEVVIANSVMLGGHSLIETGVTIAGGVGVHHFATVGRYAFVGGLARVAKDVPPYVVYEGNPAEPRKLNTTALLRRGWDVEVVERLRTAYKLLFRNHEVPMQVTMDRLRADETQPACVIHLCDFLERMQLGVHGRFLESTRSPAAPRRGRA